MQGCRGKALRCLCVHRAFIVRSSYAFDPRGGYKYKDRGKHQAYIHHISTEAYLFVMAIIPQRVAILRRMLRDEEERHDAILALLIREHQRQRRQHRRWWVKPWIERRRLVGQYYTLFQELNRESEADYMNYMRMSRDMFAELLLQVAPRITKSNRQVQLLSAVLKYNCTVQYKRKRKSFSLR